MATFNKFEGFIGYLGLGAVNLNTDTLKIYLTNATPSASLDDVKTDLAEITAGNGYTITATTTNTIYVKDTEGHGTYPSTTGGGQATIGRWYNTFGPIPTAAAAFEL